MCERDRTSPGGVPLVRACLHRLALGCAAAAALAAAGGLGDPAAALAAPPSLTITTPVEGGSTNDPMPLIAGLTQLAEGEEALFFPVEVQLYAGATVAGEAVGPPLETIYEPGESWFVKPTAPLADGTYTAQASEEQNSREGPPLQSAPVTFTVDRTPPVLSIVSPAPGAVLAGTGFTVTGSDGTAAGDLPMASVRVYPGSEAAGEPVQSIEVPSSGGGWSGTLAGLAPGVYTLQAQQADAAGNVGVSPPVPVTVAAPPAPLPPSASFTWFPEVPRVGETVTLVSSSTDTSSPLTGFAWALSGTEPLHPGLATTTTTFATPGPHVVRLQVTDAAGRTAAATKTILVRHQALALMQPFPIVRIAGRETRNGVKLTLLTVSAPISALVTVRIRGTGIRSTSQSRIAAAGKHPSPGGAALLSFPRFARPLKAGIVLEIRVTKPGQIGKLTRFIPRRGKLPTRIDSCLTTTGKPMSCPAS